MPQADTRRRPYSFPKSRDPLRQRQKMSNGMASGRTISDNSTLPRLSPTVSPAPMAPSQLKGQRTQCQTPHHGRESRDRNGERGADDGPTPRQAPHRSPANGAKRLGNDDDVKALTGQRQLLQSSIIRIALE